MHLLHKLLKLCTWKTFRISKNVSFFVCVILDNRFRIDQLAVLVLFNNVT